MPRARAALLAALLLGSVPSLAQPIAIDPASGIALDRITRSSGERCANGNAEACEVNRQVQGLTTELAGLGAACREGQPAACAAYRRVAGDFLARVRGY